MLGDEFEWDDAKAASNLEKHGVSFEDACLAFMDVFAVERVDARKPYGEPRFVLVGRARGRILTVVYTEREDRLRLISARRANKRECDDYYQNQAPP